MGESQDLKGGVQKSDEFFWMMIGVAMGIGTMCTGVYLCSTPLDRTLVEHGCFSHAPPLLLVWRTVFLFMDIRCCFGVKPYVTSSPAFM
jgi:hypothetical protein